MRNQFSKPGSNPPSQSLLLWGRAGSAAGSLGLEVAHLIREQILSCKAFQHGRVGGRNGNDGQEKTNYKKK